MQDSMAEIKASFFIECEELLENLQDGLQSLDENGSDDETVNVVFRAVHSIKGGAGAFGLTGLVNFAHRFETAMDEVRSHRLALSSDALALFFRCGDILTDLVREARDEVEHDDAVLQPVLAQLDDLVGAPADEEQEEQVEFQPAALSLDLPGLDPLPLPDDPSFTATEADTASYDISYFPETSAYEQRSEPLFLIKALAELGEIEACCLDQSVPELSNLDPEASHIGWRITLSTSSTEAEIREIFDFVDGLCQLSISPTSDAEPLQSTPSIEFDCPIDDAPAAPVENQLDEPQDAPPQKTEDESTMPATVISKTETPAAPKPAQKPRATVRVDLERIDRLVNLVGELVINQAMLAQSVEQADLSSDTAIRAGLEEFLQLTRNIQESVMMIRAQPVKSLFQRMGRIVREASADVGKSVRLRSDGENTEVDKTVIERLADPLTHMIRNAVDHGLETQETRISKGKPAEGQIRISAAHRSGRVIIEVADDGAGINRPKVHQIAVEKGLIPADTKLSDSEIDNLLFLPGFSTANEISNLSGRGVGMDVVRSSIQALGGRISITSQPGIGTTFSISLPLTLAVLDGMVVRAAGETLVLPLSAILETQTLQQGDIRAFGPSSNVVNIRDEFVPLLDLAAELGYRAPISDYTDHVLLLVANEDGSRAALIADSIEDQRQVVIKGLQDSFGRIPGVAAATILGDGHIALILDPTDIIVHASGHTRATDRYEQAGVAR